jgi:hypothetical protein
MSTIALPWLASKWSCRQSNLSNFQGNLRAPGSAAPASSFRPFATVPPLRGPPLLNLHGQGCLDAIRLRHRRPALTSAQPADQPGSHGSWRVAASAVHRRLSARWTYGIERMNPLPPRPAVPGARGNAPGQPGPVVGATKVAWLRRLPRLRRRERPLAPHPRRCRCCEGRLPQVPRCHRRERAVRGSPPRRRRTERSDRHSSGTAFSQDAVFDASAPSAVAPAHRPRSERPQRHCPGAPSPGPFNRPCSVPGLLCLPTWSKCL